MARRSATLLQQTHVQGDQVLGEQTGQTYTGAKYMGWTFPLCFRNTHIFPLPASWQSEADTSASELQQKIPVCFLLNTDQQPKPAALQAKTEAIQASFDPRTAAMSSKHLPT